MKNLFRFALVIGLGAVLFAGCGTYESTSTDEMAQTEDNQIRLAKADPPPQFDESQERKNLVRRLKLFNVPNKISYITLLTPMGQFVKYDVVKGKVSDLNSLLTTPTQVIRVGKSGGGYENVTVPSPDLDGSYGSNPNGIFYFSPDGIYHEWNGLYNLSDAPENINAHPLITVDATKKFTK